MNLKFVIIPAVIIIASVIAVFVIDSVNLDKLCAEKGGVRHGDICMVEIPDAESVETEYDLSNIKSMRPNSAEYFYYPNPEDVTNRDVFQKFVLIRLPEEIGGDTDDVSAFRAYSTLSVGVHCQIKYWPDEGRKRMEDPCWGSMYRPIDGAMMYPYPVMNDSPLGLPYLDLSIDENGSLYVEPPVWTLDENGVVGIGRHMSMQEIQKGSQILVDSYEQTNPNHPMIPVGFAGLVLAEINSNHNRANAKYSDFGFSYLHDISLEVRNVSAQDQQSFLNPAKFNSEFWQIGDTVIRIGGSALDKNSRQPEQFRDYDIEFILNGFTFAVEGKDSELIKRGIVASFFPEYSYDDLFLVSSTVEK